MPFKASERRREWVRNYNREYHKIPENGDRARARQAAYRKKYPERVRNFKYRNSYGILVQDYEAMVLVQNNKCAICGLDGKDNRYGRLSIDHCHSTRKIRGLLCNACNHMIGKSGDDPDILIKAAVYLRERS